MARNPFLGGETTTRIGSTRNPFLGVTPSVVGHPDLSSPEGLRQLAEQEGVELPKKTFSQNLLGGVSRVIDILRTGEFAVGGVLAGEGVRGGVRKKISPSDVLFGEEKPESLTGRFFLGATKLATDILLDPVTYLTLGTGLLEH